MMWSINSKNMNKIIVLCVMAWGGAICAYSQVDSASIVKWERVVSAGDDLSKTINDEDLAWPYLPAVDDPLLDDESRKLVSALATKVVANCGPLLRSRYDLEQLTSDTAAMYKVLWAGGYTNVVLFDSMRRVALARLAGEAVNDARFATEAKSIMSLVTNSVLSDDAVRKVFSIDGSIGADEWRDVVFSGISYRPSVAGGHLPWAATQLTSSYLLNNRNLPALLYRISETDMLAKCHTAALIIFLGNGGSLSDLTPNDIRKFREIMGDSLKNFRDDYMGIKRISVSHLLLFLDSLATSAPNGLLTRNQ